MKASNTLKVLVAAGAAVMMTAVATDASAQKRVRWKMQSAFGSTLARLGPQDRWLDIGAAQGFEAGLRHNSEQEESECFS